MAFVSLFENLTKGSHARINDTRLDSKWHGDAGATTICFQAVSGEKPRPLFLCWLQQISPALLSPMTLVKVNFARRSTVCY
jgi:hypothetical protein